MRKSISRYTPVPPISTPEDSTNDAHPNKDDSSKTEILMAEDSTNVVRSNKDDLSNMEPKDSPERSLENRSDIAQSSSKESTKDIKAMEEKVKKEPKGSEEKVMKESEVKRENKSKGTKEIILSDEQYMEKILPELTMRMNLLKNLENFICKECLDELNFLESASKFGTFAQRMKAGDVLTELGVAELFQKIWTKHFEMDFLSKDNKLAGEILTGILVVMWNFSDKSRLLCERVCQIGLHVPILSYLSSTYLEPSKTSLIEFKRIVSGLMGILHNMLQKISEFRESLRERKAVDIFQRFRDAPNEMIACKALILQGYIITEQENDIVHSDDTAFSFIKKILVNALKFKDHYAKAYGFSAIEVISALNRLAVNDNNQMKIVNAGLLPLYIKLLQPESSVAEQAAAAEGLWTLEFKCRKEVEKEPGCVAALQNLIDTSPDDVVVVHAKGALWMLQKDNATHQPHVSQRRPMAVGGVSAKDHRHVFISYQWDSKPIIMKLVNSLKAAGYKVWVDFDKMSGSILEGMAEAVENAVVVIVCLTQKYKESPNCRTEGEYTFRLHKDILPIRLQPRFQPDGWLGALVGNKYAFDFSSMDKYDGSFRGLSKELGERGRTGTDSPDGLVSVTNIIATSTPPPSISCNSDTSSWSTDEVIQWLAKYKIEHLQDWFRDIDGSLLIEYRRMRENAPETFYVMLKEKGFTLQDILKLNRAMNLL